MSTARRACRPCARRPIRCCTALLKEFEALTGVPVLINTSFNVKGEPIVETPRDAVICFLTTGIDHLVMHDTLVSKNAMHKVVAPLVERYSDVADLVRRARSRPDPNRKRPAESLLSAAFRRPVGFAGAVLGSGLSCRFDQEM